MRCIDNIVFRTLDAAADSLPADRAARVGHCARWPSIFFHFHSQGQGSGHWTGTDAYRPLEKVWPPSMSMHMLCWLTVGLVIGIGNARRPAVSTSTHPPFIYSVQFYCVVSGIRKWWVEIGVGVGFYLVYLGGICCEWNEWEAKIVGLPDESERKICTLAIVPECRCRPFHSVPEWQ